MIARAIGCAALLACSCGGEQHFDSDMTMDVAIDVMRDESAASSNREFAASVISRRVHDGLRVLRRAQGDEQLAERANARVSNLVDVAAEMLSVRVETYPAAVRPGELVTVRVSGCKPGSSSWVRCMLDEGNFADLIVDTDSFGEGAKPFRVPNDWRAPFKVLCGVAEPVAVSVVD